MSFQINFLDHVAIRSTDPQISADWYQSTLGLQRITHEEWGDYPIMMLSNNSGIAIFPASKSRKDDRRSVRIDHFAFNVDREDFEKAQRHFSDLGIKFEFQDHHYFHSIYLKDPDGHAVELTCSVVNDEF
ncbi:MAG: VOC family protein [Bacteroidia bacterium]|nr:VOC family protein [Bacteroidia bacterium]